MAYITFNTLGGMVTLIGGYLALKRRNLHLKEILMVSIIMGICYLIGARLLYGVLYFNRILEEPKLLWELTLHNFSVYGGLLAAFFVFNALMCKMATHPLRVTDDIVPFLGVGLILAKLGCFYNGCCYGIPTQLPWGMIFPKADQNAVTRLLGGSGLIKAISGAQSIPRHPTQLYEVGFTLLALTVVLWMSYKGGNFELKAGQKTYAFVWFYTLGRLITFFYRDFPSATLLSSFIRGPVIYTVVLVWVTYQWLKTAYGLPQFDL